MDSEAIVHRTTAPAMEEGFRAIGPRRKTVGPRETGNQPTTEPEAEGTARMGIPHHPLGGTTATITAATTTIRMGDTRMDTTRTIVRGEEEQQVAYLDCYSFADFQQHSSQQVVV